MILTIELEQEDDGRWLAEVPELAGVMAYGQTRDAARAKAKALTLRVIADQLEHGEASSNLGSILFPTASVSNGGVFVKYKVMLKKSKDGVSVSVPGLPGCWSQGATEVEALANIQEAIKEYQAVVHEQLQDADIREIEVPV